jgi:hypothetical protein
MGRSGKRDHGHRRDDSERVENFRKIDDHSDDQNVARHIEKNDLVEKGDESRLKRIQADANTRRKEGNKSKDRKKEKRSKNDSDRKNRKKERDRKHDRGDELDRHSKRKKHRHDHEEQTRSRNDTTHDRSKLFVDNSKLFSLGEVLNRPPNILLDPENDYFSQNQRFRLYLYRECGLTFDELSSNDARTIFQKFVQRYNSGELETGYYSSVLPIEAIEECPSTRHHWSLKISNDDEQQLNRLHQGVRKQTEYQEKEINAIDDRGIGPAVKTPFESNAYPVSSRQNIDDNDAE